MTKEHWRYRTGWQVRYKVNDILNLLRKKAEELGRRPTLKEMGPYVSRFKFVDIFGGFKQACKLINLPSRPRVPSKSGSNMARNQKRSSEELQAIIQLRDMGGYSLEEVGAFCGGVSRERARQLIQMGGGISQGMRAGWSTDNPLIIGKTLRMRKEVTSIKDLARLSGYSSFKVRRVLAEFDLRVPANRLFRARKWKEKEPIRQAMLGHLQKLTQSLGYTAGTIQLRGKPFWSCQYYTYFGSLRKAQELAGLVPNQIGRSKHRKSNPVAK